MKKLFLTFAFVLIAHQTQAACVLKGTSPALYVCLSGDANPVAGEGARRYNSDNKKVYAYLNSAWREITDHDNLTSKGTYTHGQIDTRVPLVDWLMTESADRNSTGMLYGGVLTNPSGTTISISAPGAGYINDSGGIQKKLEWSSPLTVGTVADGINYIVIDQSGTAIATTTYPTVSYLYCGYVLVGGGNSFVYDVFSVPNYIGQFQERINSWNLNIFGNLLMGGSQVTEQANPNFLQLNISEGYVFSRMQPYYTPATTEFMKLYNSTEGLQIDFNDMYFVNTTQWNDVTQDAANALVTMTTGSWKKDLVVQIPNGHVYYIFSPAEYATKDEALSSETSLGSLSFLSDVTILAVIVSQQGDTTVASGIIDVRPWLPRVFHQVGGSAQRHSLLSDLSYAASGHYGFASTDASTLASGALDGDRLPAMSATKRGGVPATGTPSGKFLRDDDTFAVVSGSGYATIENEGTPLTQRATLNFVGTGVDCIDDTPDTKCTINTGGTDLSAEPFVTSATSANLSTERVMNNGTNTTVDTGTAGQIKINVADASTNEALQTEIRSLEAELAREAEQQRIEARQAEIEAEIERLQAEINAQYRAEVSRRKEEVRKITEAEEEEAFMRILGLVLTEI